MTTTEKLQAMEQLWDSLCAEPTPIASPRWHERIIEARKNSIATGEAKFLTLEQLRKRLRR